MQKLTAILLCLVMLASSSCADKKKTTESVNSNAVTIEGDTIYVSADALIAGKLKVEHVFTDTLPISIHTSGVVAAIPTSYAEVAAPFAGRIQRSLVRIGQSVGKGSPLFEIYSSDFSEIVKNYRQSQSTLTTARKALERVEDLNKNKVASDKELDEARTEYQHALEDFRHASAVAKEYQINLEQASAGQPMVVRSPVAGKVLRNDLVIGEYVKDDAEAKVVVADLARVWVKANVSEQEAPLMDDIDKVTLRLVSNLDSVIEGKIVYIGGMLDAETRTLQTIIECANSKGKMMPNMYAKIELTSKGHKCIVVPNEAVLQGEKGRYVLQRIAPNTYCRKYITVQSTDNGCLIVTNGLSENDEIVTQGAFYLIDCK